MVKNTMTTLAAFLMASAVSVASAEVSVQESRNLTYSDYQSSAESGQIDNNSYTASAHGKK
jgi:hypothetical protein